MKTSKNQLPLTQHFTIQKGKAIPSIDARMRAAYQGEESAMVDIPPGPSLEEALTRVKERKERASLPHQEQLETALKQDLSWIQTQLGEEDALRLVERDWLIVGQTVFFASRNPSYEHVHTAVQEMVARKKNIPNPS